MVGDYTDSIPACLFSYQRWDIILDTSEHHDSSFNPLCFFVRLVGHFTFVFIPEPLPVMLPSYAVPADTTQCEIEVKRSRFIARATNIHCREEAMAFLAQAKIDHPHARHHCWAYLIGNPFSASSAAMNDDGEPGGTAGKPILNVMQHKKVGDIMIVVIRYFGGIKLGAGGLTRAYSSATEALFASMQLQQQQFAIQILLLCSFAQEQMVRHWVGQHDATIEAISYTQIVEITLSLPEKHKNNLILFCNTRHIKYRTKDAQP